jgi:hypothetical protein
MNLVVLMLRTASVSRMALVFVEKADPERGRAGPPTVKSEVRRTAISFQHLSTEAIKPCLSQALPYDLSLTLPFTKSLSPGRRFAFWQACPVRFFRGMLCRVPTTHSGRGSRIFSRKLVMGLTVFERLAIVLLILTSGWLGAN